MTFSVTYRNANGAMAEETVEAAGRGDCLARMKARGITPIGIKACGDRAKARPSSGEKPVVAYALGIALVALAACGVWFWIGRGKDSPSNVQDVPERPPVKVLPVKVQPAKAEPAKTEPVKTVAGDVASVTAPSKPRTKTDGEEIAVAAADTAADTNRQDQAEKQKKEPLFRHGTEQLLALATPAEPGMSVPPLPMITDAAVADDLKKAMSNVIAASPDDTERTLEIKLNVAEQKEEFRELQAEGMKFSIYVNALREKFNDDAKFLSEARKMDEDLFNDEQVSDKDYDSYRKELNRHLRERGLPELEDRKAGHSKENKETGR